MKHKTGRIPALLLITAILLTVFSTAPSLAATAADALVSIDMSAADGTSTLELGVTQTNVMWDKGSDTTAVTTARNLLSGTVKYTNQSIMGWGTDNPEPSAPVDGVHTYVWTSLDERVQNMRSDGGEMVLTFCTAPGWMKTSGQDWDMNDRVADNYVQDFADLCAAAAARYTDVKYFQVWNEMKGYWSNTVANSDGTFGNWDYVRYTDLYNAVYAAVKAVRPDAVIGGFYLPISGDGSASLGKDTVNKYDPFGAEDARDRDALDYWLQNKAGADFICVDRWLTDWHGGNPGNIDWGAGTATDNYTQEELMSLTYTYSKAIEYIRSKTDLPIWFSEYYSSQGAPGGSQFVAASMASIYYHMIKGAKDTNASDTPNDATALLWNPMEGEGFCSHYLFTGTSQAGGAQTTPHYDIYKNVNRYFGRGAQLYKATSSNPGIEVLASGSKVMIINKYSSVKNVAVNGNEVYSMAPFEVKFIDVPDNLIKNGGFEEGTANWSFEGDNPPFASTDGNRISGYKALNFWLQNPQVCTVQTTVNNCEAGAYTLSLWEKGGGQYNSVKLQVYAGNDLLQEKSFQPTDAFGKVTIDNIDVSAAVDLTIKISIDAISNLWLYIDDVTMVAVDPFVLQPVSVDTFYGIAPVMPSTVDALYEDGRIEKMAVTWDNIDPSSYRSIGSFTVNGTVAGAKNKAIATINVLPIDAPPFTVTAAGKLDKTEGIKAVVTVDRKEGTLDHTGSEVVLFQLMKNDKSVDIIALEKDIGGKEVLAAYFDVPNPKDSYCVKVFVLEEFSSNPGKAADLANDLTID